MRVYERRADFGRKAMLGMLRGQFHHVVQMRLQGQRLSRSMRARAVRKLRQWAKTTITRRDRLALIRRRR